MRRIVVILSIILVLPLCGGAEEKDIFQRLWENDLTAINIESDSVEFAHGIYVRNGEQRPFVLSRFVSELIAGTKKMLVRLDFLGNHGDKYLLEVTFYPNAQMAVTRQSVRYYKIDPGRIRKLSYPLYQALEDTQIPPFFLMLSAQLLAHYNIERITTPTAGSIVKVDTIVKGGGDNLPNTVRLEELLPAKVELELEERKGAMAPVQVTLFMYEEPIFIFRMKNELVSGQLRPFRVSITPLGQKEEIIFFHDWGTVKDRPYFDKGGFLRDMDASLNFLSRVTCPDSICK